LQNNRFYTLEFFNLLKEKLSGKAVLSIGLPAPVNYLNNEAVQLNSTIFTTLKKVFHNVLIIPGEKNYFLASDAPLTCNIVKAVHEKGIENRYVNRFYFDDILLKSRSETILSSLNPEAEVNRNLKPVLYRQQLAYWLSYFKEKYWLIAWAAGILTLLIFFTGSTSSKVMFLTGFSATGLEILLLFGLQVFFGNIYLLTGFVITSFMLGLYAGSFYGKSVIGSYAQEYLSANQMLLGVFAAMTGILLFSPGMANLHPAIVYALYLAATAIIGGLTGFQFTKATLFQSGSYAEISGSIYSYDLFGSASGALVLTLYLIPKIGIIASALIIGFLNLIFGFYLTLLKYKGIKLL
jgi:spermidine synthase